MTKNEAMNLLKNAGSQINRVTRQELPQEDYLVLKNLKAQRHHLFSIVQRCKPLLPESVIDRIITHAASVMAATGVLEAYEECDDEQNDPANTCSYIC